METHNARSTVINTVINNIAINDNVVMERSNPNCVTLTIGEETPREITGWEKMHGKDELYFKRSDCVQVQNNYASVQSSASTGKGQDSGIFIRRSIPEHEQVIVSNDNIYQESSTGSLQKDATDSLKNKTDVTLSVGELLNNIEKNIEAQFHDDQRKDGQVDMGAPKPAYWGSLKTLSKKKSSKTKLGNTTLQVFRAQFQYHCLQSEIAKQLFLNGKLDDQSGNHNDDIFTENDKLDNLNCLETEIEKKQKEFEQTLGFRINLPTTINQVKRSRFQKNITDGNVKAVRNLILNGADVYARDSKGLTPLHLCILTEDDNFIDMVQVLVRNGACINARCHLDKTLLLLAAENGKSKEDLEQLVNLGADWRIADGAGDTILHYLARQGNLPALEYFISLGLDVNARNKFHNTALNAAAFCDAENVTKSATILIKNGARVRGVGKDGKETFSLVALDNNLTEENVGRLIANLKRNAPGLG